MTPPDPRSETLAQFMVRREHELTALISALEGQLGPLKAELAALKRMKELTGAFIGVGLKADLARESDKPGVTITISDPNGVVGPPPGLWNERFAKMTIKELAIQAIIDQFAGGGTLSEIREFIKNGYGRPIEGASLRAQMHRLKADGIATQSGEIWNLDPRKRQLYGMYDHPTSRAAMPELKDDPVSDAYRTIAGGAGLDD